MLEKQIENLSSYIYVAHTTAKKIISRRGKNGTAVKCTKMKNVRAKHAKLLLSLLNMQIYNVLVAVVVKLLGGLRSYDGCCNENVTLK